VEQGQNLVINQLQRQGKEISSFMKVTGARLKNAMAAVDNNHNLITTLSGNLKAAIHSLTSTQLKLAELVDFQQKCIQTLATAVQCILSYQEHLRVIEHEAVAWLQAVYQLLEGRLPLPLVPFSQLQKVLQQTALTLAAEFPEFSMVHPVAAYYYSSSYHHVQFTKSEKYLYIGIAIPLKSLSSVFSTISLPVATNGTSFNTTQIVNAAPFFGVSRDGDYYVEFDDSFYSTCKGTGHIKHCPRVQSMRHVSIPSCTSGLYFDSYQHIMTYCQIIYKEQSLFYGAVDLGNAHYLISGSDVSWSLDCIGKPSRPIRSCVYCVISIPCSCKLSTSHFYVPAKLTGCLTNQTSVTYVHPVNLHILHGIFPSGTLADITGQSTTQKMTKVILPNLTVTQDLWSSVAAKDKEDALDFKTIAHHLKKDSKLFASKSDALLDTFSSTISTSPGPNDTLFSFSSLAGILSLVAIALSIFTLWRSHWTLGLLSMSGALPVAHSLTVHNTSYHFSYFELIAPNKTVVETIFQTIELERVIQYLILACSLVTALYVVRKVSSRLIVSVGKVCTFIRPVLTTACLELSSDDLYLMLPLAALHDLPTNIVLCGLISRPTMELRPFTCGRDQLIIGWDDSIYIQSNTRESQVMLPGSVPIPFFSRSTVARLLLANPTVRMYLRYQSVLRPIPTGKPSTMESLSETQPMGKQPPQELYPLHQLHNIQNTLAQLP
jgi:hypothetical protein